MKIITLVSSIITALLLLSTMICGFWIRANNITDPGSIDFHVNCGIAAVIFSIITMITVVFKYRRAVRHC